MGQYEDYGPGGSIFDSSEIRGKGECQYIWDFGEGKDTGNRARSLQKAAAHLVKATASRCNHEGCHHEQL